ncbi:hypothetical protein TELCIR_07313 [Teladorsagia circumcincta]|uniref:Alpha N-terminal protein methyltransferase 1 n=1 Tax=Teladorsagia circumcincta TaxID=45464 RepID=A0A2G9UKY8_TELCI|nr:hypothetical protein TELCIR_07313 [Teladorsagia circumcincta]
MALSQSKSDPANAEEFYKKAEEFWSNASRDIDGMLGGFANLHVPDIRASKTFIKKLRAKNVVMVEPVAELLEKSISYVGNDNVTRVQVGLQNFHPDPSAFDLIWIQWCSGHLTDTDMVEFLRRCIDGLTDDGVIVFKDNLSAQQESEFDCEDYSWTRPESLVLELFDRAGLRVVAENLQTGFPSGMYKVKMFALKPVTSKYAKPAN